MAYKEDIFVLTSNALQVERAISRGLILSQSNPSLAVYKQSLILLHASLAQHQKNYKLSLTLLKRITSQPDSQIPPWIVYSAHFASISSSLTVSPPEIASALSAIDEVKDVSQRRRDLRVTLLAIVLRLRTLLAADMWNQVSDALFEAETALGLSYSTPPASSKLIHGDGSPGKLQRSSSRSPQKASQSPEQVFVAFDDPLEACMALHVLIISIVYNSHVGMTREASQRLSHLHALLDSDVLSKFPEGTITVRIQLLRTSYLVLMSFLLRLN